MRRLPLIVSGLGLVAATLVTGSAALAAQPAALDYPACTDVELGLELSDSAVVGGSTLTIEALATSGNTPPVGRLTVAAFGDAHTDDKNSLRVTVETPPVDEKTLETVRSRFVGTLEDGETCVSDLLTPAVAGRSVTREKEAVVTLLPRTTAGQGLGSMLPDTGGERAVLLLGALALLVGGATLTLRGRRTRQA